MKKQLPILAFLFLFPILLFSNNKNSLASSAGTMILDEINLCLGQTVLVPHNGDETLDPGDVIRVVLHDNSGTTLGNITGVQLPINAALSSILSGITFGTTYYISAIAGMDDGTGNVDLTDPELSVAQGTPIVFVGPLEANVEATLCSGGAIIYGNTVYDMTGVYQIPLVSSQGCDSIITLYLTVLDPIETYFVETICEGDFVNIGQNPYTSTGIYTIPLISSQGCDSIIILDLTVLDPIAAILPMQDVINCSGSFATINAIVFDPNPNITYIWSGPCIEPSGFPGQPSIDVSCGGEYILEVMQVQGGITCLSDLVTVTVFEDTDAPVVDAGPDLEISCVNPSVSGFPIVTPPGIYAYSWTGPNGFTDNSQFPIFTQVGTYCFFAINLNNFCISNTDCIEVTGDNTFPTATASASNDLTCVNPSVVISAVGSSTGSNFAYQWTSSLGNVIGSDISITVSTDGDYILEVIDLTNGCTATTMVTVLADYTQPTAVINSTGAIDCNMGSVTLDGSGSGGTGSLAYLWSPSGTTPTINVTAAGTYTLTVTDTDNGCTAETTITVDDTNTLVVDLGDDTFFPCNSSEMSIVGDNISTGPDFIYSWTTVDGSFTSGETTIEPTINSPGTYILVVSDPINGCVGEDEIVIYDFNDLLTVNGNMTFSCVSSFVELDASFLFLNIDVSYSWTTSDGNFTSATDILNPTVDATGTYVLNVTDNLTGCTTDATIVLDSQVLPTVVIESNGGSVINCNTTAIVLDGSNSILSPPGIFEWSYNGVVISTSAIVTVIDVGIYELVVTDQNGCSNSELFEITSDSNPPIFTIPSELVLNCTNDFTVEVGPVVDPLGLDVSYVWNYNGVFFSTDSSIVVTQGMDGVYEVVVMDLDNGCTSSNILQVIDYGFAINIATTSAGCDLEDGTATATAVLANSLVEWSTGEQGNSITGLAQGGYSVTVTDTDNNCSRHENFFIDEDISCKVVISGYVLEDPNNTCTYDANLEGVECVMVKLNPLGIFTMTDADGYYEFVVDDGSYTVEYIGSAAVDLQCPIPGTYDVTLDTNGSISEDNHFYVIAKDLDLCITKFTGNARPGLQQFNCIQICNYSIDSQDAVATFMHDTIFSNQSPWPEIYPAYGNTIAPTYSYDAATNTFTWNLDGLAPGECRKIMWYMTVPVTAVVGDIIHSEAKVTPILGDVYPDNNCLAWDQAVTGSYDPNDKRNFVGESQWGGAIYEDDVTMEYAIRFQNVGNDTAFTVVVRDTLDDEHLDVTSIRGFTSSHDMEVQFEDSNVLIFTFNNIMLVDSATNEPASNGWLNFDIDRKPNQSFGTEITNQAAIYFDFNEPVITNELINVLTDPVHVFSPNKNTIDVEVSPTVTDDEIRVHYVMEKSNPVSIQIYNVEGVLMQGFDYGKKQTGKHIENISLKSFTSGVYFVFVKTEEGSAVRKVVKM